LVFAASVEAGKKKLPAKPVNLNTATADKILQMRKSYGAFKSVDDLLEIRGLGPKRLEKMRKYLTVGKPAPKSNAFPNQMPDKHPRANPEPVLSPE
jgi:Helix-hairpin-helix motif